MSTEKPPAGTSSYVIQKSFVRNDFNTKNARLRQQTGVC